MSFSYSKQHKDNYKNLPSSTVLGWIEEVTGETLDDVEDPKKSLSNGQVLCKLINSMKPGKIKKIHKSKLGYMKMENLSFFCRACKDFGVPESDMMSVVDLYDGTNIPQVLICLESLSRCSRNISEFSGPYIGAKLSSKNVRGGGGRKKGEGISESFWETKMKKAAKKANVFDRAKHKNIRDPDQEKKLYNKEYNEDEY